LTVKQPLTLATTSAAHCGDASAATAQWCARHACTLVANASDMLSIFTTGTGSLPLAFSAVAVAPLLLAASLREQQHSERTHIKPRRHMRAASLLLLSCTPRPTMLTRRAPAAGCLAPPTLPAAAAAPWGPAERQQRAAGTASLSEGPGRDHCAPTGQLSGARAPGHRHAHTRQGGADGLFTAQQPAAGRPGEQRGHTGCCAAGSENVLCFSGGDCVLTSNTVPPARPCAMLGLLCACQRHM
jgi:hypothetical protein